MPEIFFCSHCGHEVNKNDEFCFACESVFAGTAMAAHSRLRVRSEEEGELMKLPRPLTIEYAL
jgi:hypothetical protein